MVEVLIVRSIRSCGCAGSYSSLGNNVEIIYCPMHQAALAMFELLRGWADRHESWLDNEDSLLDETRRILETIDHQTTTFFVDIKDQEADVGQQHR